MSALRTDSGSGKLRRVITGASSPDIRPEARPFEVFGP